MTVYGNLGDPTLDNLRAAVGQISLMVDKNIALLQQPNAFVSVSGTEAVLETVRERLRRALEDSTDLPSITPLTINELERGLRSAIAALLVAYEVQDTTLFLRDADPTYLSEEAWAVVRSVSQLDSLVDLSNREQAALTERLRLGLMRCGLPLSPGNHPDIVVDVAIAWIEALRTTDQGNTANLGLVDAPSEKEVQLSEELDYLRKRHDILEKLSEANRERLSEALGHDLYPWGWHQLIKQAKDIRDEVLHLRVISAQHTAMHAAITLLFSEVRGGQTFTATALGRRLRAVLDAGGPTSHSERVEVRDIVELHNDIDTLRADQRYLVKELAHIAGFSTSEGVSVDKLLEALRDLHAKSIELQEGSKS